MKKIRKMICIAAITVMACFACTACGKTYQEVINQSDTSESLCNGYFTVITKWGRKQNISNCICKRYESKILC